jgi:hypothetical protein
MTSPREVDAPAAPPLRAVFLVWPGAKHGQTWMFLWLGVAYLIGALLPWHGPNDVEYVLEQPYPVTSDDPRTSLTRVHYEQLALAHDLNPTDYPALPPVATIREPGLGFGTFLILLGAISMVVAGICSIWNRRLSLTPTLCTWFLALAVLYFSKGHWSGEAGERLSAPDQVGGFAQMGATLGAVFGNFEKVIQGEVTKEMARVFDRFGLGFYVTMLAQICLIVFILYSIFLGGTSKKDVPPPSSAVRRARPPSPGGLPVAPKKDGSATN